MTENYAGQISGNFGVMFLKKVIFLIFFWIRPFFAHIFGKENLTVCGKEILTVFGKKILTAEAQ